MSKSARDRIRTDPRLRQRRVEVERTRRRRILGVLTTLAIAGVCVWGAFFSPLLAVQEVRLVGSAHTTRREVLAATGVAGDNLLLVSAGKLEEQVQGLPWVARAKVDRILPDTVRVTISERRAAMVIDSVRGSWTVDKTGRVLQQGHAGDKLPVLEAAATGELEPGKVVTAEGAVAVLEMWRSLPVRLREDVVALFAPTAERISFSLADRTLVRYGGARLLGSKRRVLVALLARLREQGRAAAYIDVRVPSNPAIAPATTATPSPATSASQTPSPTQSL